MSYLELWNNATPMKMRKILPLKWVRRQRYLIPKTTAQATPHLDLLADLQISVGVSIVAAPTTMKDPVKLSVRFAGVETIPDIHVPSGYLAGIILEEMGMGIILGKILEEEDVAPQIPPTTLSPT